jgi:hypothetical protein
MGDSTWTHRIEVHRRQRLTDYMHFASQMSPHKFVAVQ